MNAHRISNACIVHGCSPGVRLEQQFREDSKYVDILANECPSSMLFSSDIKLLPPDIAKQLERRKQEANDSKASVHSEFIMLILRP